MRRRSAVNQEIDLFIAQDGTQYILSPLIDRSVLGVEGTGMPPIEYVTERGPFQDGETVRDYFLRPRIMQYIIRQRFCSRQEYYNGRAALLDALRPNRGVNGVIRKIQPNGTKRDFTVAILEGPRFEADPRNSWQAWSFEEILRFIAHNPVAFDPTQQTFVLPHPSFNEFPYTFPFTFAAEEQLVYPITYPIQYEHFDNAQVLEYQGNWKEYPTIVVTGPARDYIEIQNESTGHSLVLSGGSGFDTLGIGETLTFTLTYATKQVTGPNDENYVGKLTSNSDLAEFHIQPGDNVIRAVIYGAGAVTNVTFNYYNRYVGY